MKLILRQYLASLRERDELDAVLPDLLSQLGMSVFSRPGRGTRQDGVDVAAVGRLEGDGEDKVYLFSVKPGNLTRTAWDGDSAQALRPSLNEIRDSYIPNRLPAEHKDKPIVIVICVGGDVQEQVRQSVEGYILQASSEQVGFVEWNGDKLADLIERYFLREDLLPEDARPMLRKALAMLDEPASSYGYFSALIRSLAGRNSTDNNVRTRTIRQMGICLWILYAWGRDAGNLESPYLSSEFALLHAWSIVRFYAGDRTKAARAVQEAFTSILGAYQSISSEYVKTRILPVARKRDALASAVRSGCALDVNLKLFDVLGRVAVKGLWAIWLSKRIEGNDEETRQQYRTVFNHCVSGIKAMVSNNPVLLLPRKDDQAIDIWLAVTLLALSGSAGDIRVWLTGMLERAAFAYRSHGLYPCNLNSYTDLLDHPEEKTQEYRENVTRGSILYPMMAFWAALFGFDELYSDVAYFKEHNAPHCNFQFWYPDDTSEEHFYTNTDSHGATMSPLPIERPAQEFLEQIFGECDHSPQCRQLSAIRMGFWPIILVACRHYRLPLPIHLFENLRQSDKAEE